MPKYKVLERSFIGNTIVEPGAIVEYEFTAGSNLELIEPEAEAKPKGKAKPKAESEPEAGGDLV